VCLRIPQCLALDRAPPIGDDRRMTATTARELKRIAEGREAEIFAWEPGVVLKLFRDSPHATRQRDTELAAMSAVSGSGPLPAALGTIELDGRPGLLIERVDGVDMLTKIGKQPWSIFDAGAEMGRVHARVHATQASPHLETLHGRLTRHMKLVATQRPDLADRGLRVLAGLPEGDRLLHGDFHPGNIILSPRGPVVIDWPNATRGDPSADLARTMLMMRLGDLPPGTPWIIKRLEKVGRGLLRSRYLSSYRNAASVDMATVDRWTVPVAIGRLTEGIEPEYPKILKLLGVDQS
jgi:aminoglycoside phosphotransferase (APT) family kinase protein